MATHPSQSRGPHADVPRWAPPIDSVLRAGNSSLQFSGGNAARGAHRRSNCVLITVSLFSATLQGSSRWLLFGSFGERSGSISRWLLFGSFGERSGSMVGVRRIAIIQRLLMEQPLTG
jgi:hypothetical protein